MSTTTAEGPHKVLALATAEPALQRPEAKSGWPITITGGSPLASASALFQASTRLLSVSATYTRLDLVDESIATAVGELTPLDCAAVPAAR